MIKLSKPVKDVMVFRIHSQEFKIHGIGQIIRFRLSCNPNCFCEGMGRSQTTHSAQTPFPPREEVEILFSWFVDFLRAIVTFSNVLYPVSCRLLGGVRTLLAS